jgi:hypothetical protein
MEKANVSPLYFILATKMQRFAHMQPEKIKVPVQCHVGTEDKFVLAEVCQAHALAEGRMPSYAL